MKFRLKFCPQVIENCLKMLPKRSQNCSKWDPDGLWSPVWAPDRFQAPSRQQNSAHFGSKIGPKIDPAAFQNRFGKRLRNKLAFETDLGPIVDRSWLDLGWPLDPKILQNYVRGVRNQTLRLYTLDADPMCFRTDFRYPK